MHIIWIILDGIIANEKKLQFQKSIYDSINIIFSKWKNFRMESMLVLANGLG